MEPRSFCLYLSFWSDDYDIVINVIHFYLQVQNHAKVRPTGYRSKKKILKTIFFLAGLFFIYAGTPIGKGDLRVGTLMEVKGNQSWGWYVKICLLNDCGVLSLAENLKLTQYSFCLSSCYMFSIFCRRHWGCTTTKLLSNFKVGDRFYHVSIGANGYQSFFISTRIIIL